LLQDAGGIHRHAPCPTIHVEFLYEAALAQPPILGYPNRQLCESTVLHITREGFYYR
jgi:hypothetical protein